MKKSRIFLGIVTLILLPAILWIGIGITRTLYFFALGHPVDVPPETLAYRIYINKWDAGRCFDLEQALPTMGPTVVEKRMTCVYEIAELNKDAHACELLMPAEYGLACLSNVEGKLQGKIPCVKFYGENRIFCNEAYSEGESSFDDPQITNCNAYLREDVREWCHFERSQFIIDVNECDDIKNPDVFMLCKMRYAFKHKDISLCGPIIDKNRKEYCEVRISTWLQFPELRSSEYFGRKLPVGGMSMEEYLDSDW